MRQTAYSEASRSLLLKEAINPPKTDDILRHVLETVQDIKDQQDKKPREHNRDGFSSSQRRDNRQRFNSKPNKFPAQNKQRIVCFFCGKIGHYSND